MGLQRQWDLAPGFRFLLSGENADVSSGTEDTTRSAISAALVYGGTNGISAMSKNEIRYETGDTRRVQLLTFNQLDYKLSEGFTLLAKYRYSKTRDRVTDRVEARFEERSLGVAYRPVSHDRFNSIARYTRLVDVDPLNDSRSIAVDRKMDVVSIETVWQLSDKLEWVTKEATRFQEERIGDRAPVDSTTFLTVQRFNYNLYRQFDLGMEYRILALDETDDRREGWLTEAGWRVRRHMRFGLGYNFTDFSDSEFSQNDYSVRGWFFRIQGMY